MLSKAKQEYRDAIKEKVEELMADNRERTTNDIAVRLKIDPQLATSILRGMSMQGRLKTSTFHCSYKKKKVADNDNDDDDDGNSRITIWSKAG